MSHTASYSYPRPDFERSYLTWSSLNGPWSFAFDDEDRGLTDRWQRSGLLAVHRREIKVPYVFQTPESGIDDQGAHEVVWYEREVSDIRTETELRRKYRLLLRFGAVDYEATVWVNGSYVGGHQGGHVPFDIDITDAIELPTGPNRITVRVRDSPYDLTQPRGKQYWKPKPESIFYTPSSGIWQNVWLESVPCTRIADSSHGTILRSNNIHSGILHAEISVLGRRAQEPLTVEVSARIGAVSIGQKREELVKETSSVILDLPMWIDQHQVDELSNVLPSSVRSSFWKNNLDKYLALWAPEHPFLYDITIKLLRPTGAVLDEIHTTTGMRSLSWNNRDNTFRLNDRPYFHALVLDQGYWPHTNMTPPTSEALRLDIEISKAMGFNGCRKHQKVEDPIFLYWADRLGYLVWGEMANSFEFSSAYTERFDAEWREAVLRDINHPCIVTWTPTNESWGYTDLRNSKRQRDHLRSLYHMTKVLDATRPVNDNCGWEHVCTDLTTFHEYADAAQLRDVCANLNGIIGDKGGRPMFLPRLLNDAGSEHLSSAPILCTEFGGVNMAPAEGEESSDGDWGYHTASDPGDLLKHVEDLVMGVVEGGLCCGFVYTQLTDIEQEVNGLYSYDRKPKLEAAKVKAIMDTAKARYFERLEQRI